VPRLSELRHAAGQGAFEAGTIDTIHRMISEGELPWGDRCALSEHLTNNSVELTVECEQKWVRGSRDRILYPTFRTSGV
jgi:hypothetical protein